MEAVLPPSSVLEAYSLLLMFLSFFQVELFVEIVYSVCVVSESRE